MKHPRGMTLLEMVLALTLLAVLASVSISWAMGFARLAGETGDRTRWDRAVLEVRRSLEDDLWNQDARLAQRTQRAAPEDRVRVEESTVTVQTRAPGLGSVEVQYRFDAHSRTLVRVIAGTPEVLVGQVEEASFAIADGVLRVEIAGSWGTQTFEIELPSAGAAQRSDTESGPRGRG